MSMALNKDEILLPDVEKQSGHGYRSSVNLMAVKLQKNWKLA